MAKMKWQYVTPWASIPKWVAALYPQADHWETMSGEIGWYITRDSAGQYWKYCNWKCDTVAYRVVPVTAN